MISEPLIVGQSVQAIDKPLEADGTPSPATLSNLTFQSSDPTIFTVDANGIITALKAGSAALTTTGLATEPDGKTTENITGSATILVTAPAPPPAASIGITFGTPFASVPVAPASPLPPAA